MRDSNELNLFSSLRKSDVKWAFTSAAFVVCERGGGGKEHYQQLPVHLVASDYDHRQRQRVCTSTPLFFLFTFIPALFHISSVYPPHLDTSSPVNRPIQPRLERQSLSGPPSKYEYSAFCQGRSNLPIQRRPMPIPISSAANRGSAGIQGNHSNGEGRGCYWRGQSSAATKETEVKLRGNEKKKTKRNKNNNSKKQKRQTLKVSLSRDPTVSVLIKPTAAKMQTANVQLD